MLFSRHSLGIALTLISTGVAAAQTHPYPTTSAPAPTYPRPGSPALVYPSTGYPATSFSSTSTSPASAAVQRAGHVSTPVTQTTQYPVLREPSPAGAIPPAVDRARMGTPTPGASPSQPVQQVRYLPARASVTLVSQAAAVPPSQPAPPLPPPESIDGIPIPDSLAVSASILSDQVNPINLEAAFNLGGVQNPQIRLAGQQISQAVAERQFAIAQVFPTINVGTNFDSHTGTLQQSSGNILKVNRNALYAGAGANAVAAGTVNIPGILWDGNLSVSLFNYLKARQLVAERQANLFATSNHMLLEVAARYFELMRAEQARAIAIQIRGEAREVARITASYAATGQGREADANRAATEFRRRDVQVLEFEGDVLRASAQLAQLLNLDPSVRLHPTDPWAVPLGIVPEDLTLPQLLSIGLTQRPEMAERQAAVRFAFLNLRNFKVLPFSPNTRIGFSAGTFGGGSNLSQPPYNVSPYFGNFSARSDFDVIAYWTLKNCAVGNVALINKAAAEYNITDLELLKTLNTVRAQVASAQAKALARFAQIAINERAVQTGQAGFSEDLVRTKAAEGLPIEVLNNLDLLARARFELLAAIIEYNVAEFELYVALGQPPATALAMSGNPLPGAEEIPTPNAAAPQGPVLPQPLPAPEKETQP